MVVEKRHSCLHVKNRQADYDEKLGQEFILTCQVGGTVTFHHRDLIKSIDVLNNILTHFSLIKTITICTQRPYKGTSRKSSKHLYRHRFRDKPSRHPSPRSSYYSGFWCSSLRLSWSQSPFSDILP